MLSAPSHGKETGRQGLIVQQMVKVAFPGLGSWFCPFSRFPLMDSFMFPRAMVLQNFYHCDYRNPVFFKFLI